MVHDHQGRLTQVTDGSGNGVGYGFDALGRPVRESRLVAGVEHYRVDSRYDAGGRRDRVAHGDGFALTYGWRPDGLPLSVVEEGAVSGPGVLATYGYDAQGRLDRVDRGNGVVSRYGYDGSNRLTALGHDAAGTSGDVALGFTYGAAGQILTRALDNSAYAAPLPAAGDVTGVADALNRLSSIGGVAISHDAAGRVTADGSATYGYDEAGRLVSVTPAGGGAAVGLSYDVLGRLSRVAVAGQAAVNLAYDGLDVVAELDDAGTILRRYAHGAGADNVLASYDGAGTGNRRWLLADERGSVIAGTDGSGAVSGINAYDEYGVPAPGNSGLFQYTGQVRIPGTGLYHYKARAYHPGLGRFLQPDPMGYADGVNLYAYVGNDPVNLVDPLGLQGKPPPPTSPPLPPIIVDGYRTGQYNPADNAQRNFFDDGQDSREVADGYGENSGEVASSCATSPNGQSDIPEGAGAKSLSEAMPIARRIAEEELIRTRRITENYKLGGHNDIYDAERHARWVYRMSIEIGSGWAGIFATGHEVEGMVSMQPIIEMQMDIHNNYVGLSSALNGRGIPTRSTQSLYYIENKQLARNGC